MSVFPEYDKFDGLGLAKLVRTRQVTPAELVEEAVSRIEACNPQLNAVVHKLYGQARAAARDSLPDGPFKGVPFLLKDLFATMEGVPTSNGNRLLKGIPAPHDSEMVARFKNSGVIILGKTNTPELGITPFTEPETHGPTRNPWDTSRTPGGSSGGSAAGVAARMVPLASGGDGGGSIRIPASCCGLFGLMPTRGRNPTGPDAGEVWHGFATEHVITRSVRDSAAMLDAVSGPDIGAPYITPAPERPFLEEVSRAPGKLRIAFTSKPFLGHEVDADCIDALYDASLLLQGLGHELVEDAPEINGEQFSVSFLTIIMAETRADIELVAKFVGRDPHHSHWEPSTYAMGLIGQSMSGVDYANAARYLQLASREIGRFFARYDVLLTPTLSRPPVPIGSLQPPDSQMPLIKLVGRLNATWLLRRLNMVKPLAARVFDFIPYTPIFNVTGQPAMSVPLYWNREGLPIGVQFAGRFGDEATLFRLAGQLERARPWFDRAPALIVA